MPLRRWRGFREPVESRWRCGRYGNQVHSAPQRKHRSQRAVDRRMMFEHGDENLRAQWRRRVSDEDFASIDAASTLDANTGSFVCVGCALRATVPLDTCPRLRRTHQTDGCSDTRRLEFATGKVVVPCIYLTVDDNHRYAHADLTRFTSQRIVDAKHRVLESTTDAAPFTTQAVIDPILGGDQTTAVTAISPRNSGQP